MNSQDYIEVAIRLEPFSEELAERIVADLSELPYDSFLTEEPFLKAYIQREDLVVEGKVTVKSPAAGVLPRTRFNIWIDPGMAFGTGAHHTTYMMIGRMLSLEMQIRDHSVLDMGCGTGVLGILAAKMGARKVFAVDIDAVAARSAWGNVHWNRVASRVETACGDASLLQAGTYDLILANIHRNILIEDMPTYFRSLRRGGRILLSGFFEADIPAVADAVQASGGTVVGSSLREGWACIECMKER